MRKLHQEQAAGEKPSEYVRKSRQVYLTLKLIKGSKNSAVAREADLCDLTVRNLRTGKTQFPRFATMAKILSTVDATLEVVKDGQIIRKWN